VLDRVGGAKGQADARRGHQGEQSSRGWADAVSGKGRLIFLYSGFAKLRVAELLVELDRFAEPHVLQNLALFEVA
jgi:hypothetical protein